MTVGFIFWLLMLFWGIFGAGWGWHGTGEGPARWRGFGGNALLFILIFLLGLATFGWPIKG